MTDGMNESVKFEERQLLLCDKSGQHRFLPMVKYNGKERIEQYKCLFCLQQRSEEMYKEHGDAL